MTTSAADHDQTSADQTSARRVEPIGAVTMPGGYRAGATIAGIKESGLPDLALLASGSRTFAAAVYTKNVVQAAPLQVSREHLQDGQILAVVVNSGNANCATGPQGVEDAAEMTRLAAERLGCAAADVFVNSTGIIGHYLPMEKIAAGIKNIELSSSGGGDFAQAILTTDTFVKEAVATFEANGRQYMLGGCCKGAGMIHPDMATMLAFLTTDAPIAAEVLDARLRYAVDRSLNMVTVDGDTSTNDTVLLMANGAKGGPEIDAADGAGIEALDGALASVCTKLAQDIARDGEGSTKLIEMDVTGAASWEDARDVARSVVRSPLLKAALSKGDPNWGRVLMAAGYAGVDFDPDAVRLWLGGKLLVEAGASVGVPEAEAAEAVRGDTITIRLDLGSGEASARAWGCDLTEEYVRFNADYVT